MARWITVKPTAVPFDYRWPNATAITAFTQAGEFFVRDDLADFAVGKGHATEGRKKGSTARSTKGRTGRRKSGTAVADGTPTRTRADAAVVRADLADHGAASRAGSVDPNAE